MGLPLDLAVRRGGVEVRLVIQKEPAVVAALVSPVAKIVIMGLVKSGAARGAREL